MGADDDADCVEHVWQLKEAVLGFRGAAQVKACTRCGAISYGPEGGGRRPLLSQETD